MSLFDRQWSFFQDLMLLGTQVRAAGWSMAQKEVFRPHEMADLYRQRGLSKAIHSDHEDGLASDFYFRTPNGEVLVEQEECRKHHDDLAKFGAFWKSLNKLNYWGGDWKDPYDPYHFGTKAG